MLKKIKYMILISFFFTFGFCESVNCCIPVNCKKCTDELVDISNAFYYPKYTALKCSNDIYINASFLLMQVTEDGLENSIDQNRLLGDSVKVEPLIGGHINGFEDKDYFSNWNYGAKVSLGTYLDYDEWELKLLWNFLRIKNNQKFSNSNGILLPFWLDAELVPQSDANTCIVDWKGYFHSLDLMLSKPYHVSRKLILNPLCSIKFGYISQDFDASYSGTFEDPSTAVQDQNLSMNANNDFWGLGMSSGLNTEWIITNNFNIFADGIFSLLVSKFDIHQKEHFDAGAIRYDISDDFYTIVPTFEIDLGVVFKKFFLNERCMVNLKVGYEFLAFFNVNHLRRFYEFASSEVVNISPFKRGLYMNGFMFNIGLDF